MRLWSKVLEEVAVAGGSRLAFRFFLRGGKDHCWAYLLEVNVRFGV